MSVYSRVAFNGYSFPAAFSVETRETGWVMAQQPRLLKAKGNAGIFPTLGPKIIKLRGLIGGAGSIDSSGAFILNIDQARAELNLMVAALDGGLQHLTLGQSDSRYCICQATSLRVTAVEGTAQQALEIELEMEAPDPRFLGTTVHTATANGTVNNAGSAITYPVMSITGPVDVQPLYNLVYQVTPAGSSYSSGLFKVTSASGGHAILSGHTLVIDSTPGNRGTCVQDNGSNALHLLTDLTGFLGPAAPNSLVYPTAEWLPYMVPGNSTLSVGLGNSITATFVFAWQDAWAF